MNKKILFILLLSIATAAIVFFVLNGQKEEPEEERSPDSSKNEGTVENDFDAAVFIGQIVEHAEKGMLAGFPFIAGKTSNDEVNEKLGGPEQISDHEGIGRFAVYSDHDITIGYKKDVAFDLRSYDSRLQHIHYEDLIHHLGNADEVKYYKDNEHDQIILIYHVSENYHLKWILERPTDENTNPEVHHISVVALTISDEQQGKSPVTVEERVKKMTLDEKIGQMIFAGISGTKPDAEADQLVAKYKVGGIIFNKKNLQEPAQTVAYINHLKSKNSANGIPLFFGIDQEGGKIAKLPGGLHPIPANQKIGEINNPSFSYEIGSLLGRMVDAFGFNMNFAPVLDVNSNPDNPVIGERSFGADPETVSRLGIMTMKGMQKENIIPVIKHFPGHGDTSVDSHLALPVVNKTKAELEKVELVPFRRAVAEGADVVMIGHILFPKLDRTAPSSMSKTIITDLLRNELGFSGVVITDDMTMKAITDNYDIGKAAVASVKAGSDIIMVAHEHTQIVKVFSELKSAVQRGEISEGRINESVIRILKLKEKYSLDDSARGNVSVPELNRMIDAVLNRYVK